MNIRYLYRVSKEWGLRGAFAVVVLVGHGCTTHRVTPRASHSEGPEIKGTERFELHIKEMQRERAGMNENIRIVHEKIERNFKVEHWRRTWNEVDRTRYLAVAGVHDDYSGGTDFTELLLWPLIAGIVIIGAPFSDNIVYADLIGLLPFVTSVDIRTRETIIKRVREAKVTPVFKKENASTQAIHGRRLDWDVTQPDGRRLGRGRINWPQSAEIPLVEWVIENPDVPFWDFSIASPDMNLHGVKTLRLNVNLADAVQRRWPDPADRPMPGVSIRSAGLFSSDGKKIKELYSGRDAILKLEVRNGLVAPTAYSLRPVVRSQRTSLTWEVPEAISYLDRRGSHVFEIPLRSPIDAATENVSLNVGIQDIFNRSLASETVEINLIRSDLPALRLHSLRIRPSGKTGHYMLEAVVNNAGRGAASNVSLSISCGSLLGFSGVVEVKIAHVPPFSMETVTFEIGALVAGNIHAANVLIAEDLGLPPVSIAVDVIVEQEI